MSEATGSNLWQRMKQAYLIAIDKYDKISQDGK